MMKIGDKIFMPIYEFRCTACDHIQEVLVSSSSSDVEMKCNACGSEDLVRVLSTVSYAMGSSSVGSASGPCMTTKSCGPGNSCSTLQLPGYSR